MILSASFQSIQANFAPNQKTKIQSPEMQRTVDQNTAFISSFSNMRYICIYYLPRNLYFHVPLTHAPD